MSHRTTLSDLIAAIAKNMTAAELAKAAVNIQIQQMIHDTRIKKGWTQKDLADKMGVNRSTIIRWLNYLESKNALVRIPVAGKVCAYALDPHEVWKGYNTSKDYSAFVTKTLVNNDGDIKRRIMSMFSSNE